MGEIRASRTGGAHPLEPEHLVGRAQNCSLSLHHKHVSGRHAIVRYTSAGWCVRDLNSLNGTFVDGEQLKPGEERPLHVGSKVAFGRLEHEWQLTDDAPPCAMAIPLNGEKALLAEHEVLAVPSSQEPSATIFRNSEGAWVLERAEALVSITNQQVFEVNGNRFRFVCPDNISQTSLADPLGELAIRHLSLSFAVSRDEEHVELRLSAGVRMIDLGARNHNYLLLTLARARLADSNEGMTDSSCGWLYLEDLVRDLKTDAAQLNIDVFRIRKQFAASGVLEAANIVERRPRTRQLRIGVHRISIIRL